MRRCDKPHRISGSEPFRLLFAFPTCNVMAPASVKSPLNPKDPVSGFYVWKSEEGAIPGVLAGIGRLQATLLKPRRLHVAPASHVVRRARAVVRVVGLPAHMGRYRRVRSGRKVSPPSNGELGVALGLHGRAPAAATRSAGCQSRCGYRRRPSIRWSIAVQDG